MKIKKKMMIAVGLMICAIFGAAVWANFVKANKLSTVAVFALDACNGCTQTKQEIEQIKAEYPQLKFTEYMIDAQSDMVNRYGVKTHPTLLFLNQENLEIGRIEKRTDYATIKAKITTLLSNPPAPLKLSDSKQTAPGSVLHTFYLVDAESGAYQAVKQFAPQKSQVNYDKINAVTHLLALRNDLPKNLVNPIPSEVNLVRSISEGDITVILLSEELGRNPDARKREQTAQVIANTLFELNDVKKVQVRSENYSSPVYESKAGLISSNMEYAPRIIGNAAPAKGIREYNANILHGKDISFLPCYCGCGSAGHQSNFNCYFKKFEDGGLYIDMHGENCETCLDITRLYLKLKAEGKPLKEIREAVEKQYTGSKPTDTPRP